MRLCAMRKSLVERQLYQLIGRFPWLSRLLVLKTRSNVVELAGEMLGCLCQGAGWGTSDHQWSFPGFLGFTCELG